MESTRTPACRSCSRAFISIFDSISSVLMNGKMLMAAGVKHPRLAWLRKMDPRRSKGAKASVMLTKLHYSYTHGYS